MRAGIVAGCIGLALLTSGCDPNDGTYFRSGIGTKLYTVDAATATEYQNIYLEYLCRQSSSYVGADVPGCAQQAVPANFWPVIVQAGLNDIDARCDSYLAWLDQKRRENAGILAEIGAVRIAVDALTNPNIAGVSGAGLAAISAAFGLATNTVSNFNSLLLQVDHTTVQNVVFTNRQLFRRDLLRYSSSIDNKPAAVHTLRTYLNICLPMTISAKINSTVTVFQQTGTSGGAGPMLPAISAPVAPQVVIRTDRPPPPTPAVRLTVENPIGDVEKNSFTRDEGKAFQRAICVTDSGNFGPSGSETRAALRNFYRAQQFPRDSSSPETVATDSNLRSLRNAQATIPSCQAAGLANAFEVGVLTRPVDVAGTIDPMKNVSDIVVALEKASIAVPAALRSPTFGPNVSAALREVIPKLRNAYNLSGPAELDRALYNRIIRAAAPN